MYAVLYAELHEVDLDLLVQLDSLLHDDGARALLQLEVGEPDTRNTLFHCAALFQERLRGLGTEKEPSRNRELNRVAH